MKKIISIIFLTIFFISAFGQNNEKIRRFNFIFSLGGNYTDNFASITKNKSIPVGYENYEIELSS